MGWGNCGTDSKGRSIGYCHAARCDHPGCREKIDRGLSYACGDMHGLVHAGGADELDGFDLCCEGYFCSKHLRWPCFEHEDGADLDAPQLCLACTERAEIAYRTDPEWRSLWPTDAPPLTLERLSPDTHRLAETAKTGSVRSMGSRFPAPKGTVK